MFNDYLRDMVDKCVEAGLLTREIDPETEEVYYKPTEYGLRMAAMENDYGQEKERK